MSKQLSEIREEPAPLPPEIMEDFSLARIPPKGTWSPLGYYAGSMLATLCLALAMFTIAMSIVALIICGPAFAVLLDRKPAAANPFRRRTVTGFAALAPAAGIAIGIFGSSAAVLAVFVGPLLFLYHFRVFSDIAWADSLFTQLAAIVLLGGSATASWTAYAVARRFFPLGKDV